MGRPLCRVIIGGAVKQPGKIGTQKPDQLSLQFPEAQRAFGDLTITAVNEAAFHVARTPDLWPKPVICVVGPAGCGLTALAQAWAREFSAELFDSKRFSRLKRQAIAALASGYIAIDDAEKIGSPENLLTLLNSVPEAGGKLLLTSHQAPSQWRTTSPDLKSRLNSMAMIEIGAPDELTVKARLAEEAEKYFLKLDADLVKYLVPRLELSYEAVETFVERLNDAVTLTGRAPSVPMAKDILDSIGAVDPDSPPDT